jgi:pimeloyl-ACP methyl ester carboxylesterase
MATRRTTAETLGRDGSAAFLDGFAPRALGPSPDPQVVARLRAIADRQPAEAMADATMAIATRDDHTALLPGITVPTLLVVGEHDAVTTPAEHTEMAAAIPGATLAIIGGAGHMTALEQPAEFADLVLAHISA